jgi:hypothetical protein
MADHLIGYITEDGAVCTKNFSDYLINSSYAGRWFKGEEKIPTTVSKAANDGKLRKTAHNNVTLFIEGYLYEEKLETICTEIYPMVQTVPTLSSRMREDITLSFNNHNWVDFLTCALIVALQEDNDVGSAVKKKHEKNLASSIEIVNYLLARFGKPVRIVVPDDPTQYEISYVKALLEAYADDAKVKTITREELKENPNYKDYLISFNHERRCYYAAESVREATRDSVLFKNPDLSFDGLKKEIKNGTIETYKSEYSSSFKRMVAVTEKAVVVPITSLLSSELKWVTNPVKIGTVHEIINDEDERWETIKHGE